MTGWTLHDLPWHRFDPQKVNADLLKVVKAAALVESNAGDYAAYLCRVFHDDPDFQAEAHAWSVEEVRHGEALARYAEMADPSFQFQSSFRRFVEGYALPDEGTQSVRGSRSGELVARCIVEVGTSSFYASLADATDEPLLKEICRRIASDELRHFKLFYTNLNQYLARDRIGRWRRLSIALGRISETEDDELAFAYFAANGAETSEAAASHAYVRAQSANAYLLGACRVYERRHVERGIGMILKAAGIRPTDWLRRAGAALFMVAVKLRLSRARLAMA